MILSEQIALSALLLACVFATVRCQVSDGDESFQAYHQDIGRISASNSPVAPETVVRHQQLTPAEPVETPAPLPVARAAPNFDRPARQQVAAATARQPVASVPKRNRITLAPIRQREQEPLLTPIVEPQSMTTTLLEPQQEPQAPAAQLIAPPPQQQVQYLPQPTYQSLAPERSSSSGQISASSSVTPRHSALIAQVAAERQAEQNQNHNHRHRNQLHHSHHQPSLGSPIEALSSPSVAQVQAPPTLASTFQQAPSQISAAASPALTFINQPEEPLVAPSFEHVMSRGCPGKGVFSYENKDHCDRYYMCTNGTFTEEACPNGLAYSQMGAVYQHCAYNWNVDCGRKKTAEPLASPGCPWQFGIFPIAAAGRCSIDYFVCEWGVPETKRCSPEGLFYDDRIKGCQWADQLGCKSEALLNFKCPPEDEDNPYWPYPRYYHTNRDIIVCVNEQPRLVHCNDEQIVDGSSLACMDLKKKKKF